MTDYAQHFTPNVTPQSEAADPRQVENSAGGFVFQLSPMKQLERFLILGCDGGSYYATEREMTRDNAKVVLACLARNGLQAVDVITGTSHSGRAPKNDAAIFALALAAASKDPVVSGHALANLGRVVRTGTHLFQFVETVMKMRGFGPALRKAIARWYNAHESRDLMYQLTKYQQRNGMSHERIFRLAHPRLGFDVGTDATGVELVRRAGIGQAVARWVIGAPLTERAVAGSRKHGREARHYVAAPELPPYLAAFDELKTANEKRTIELILEHGFTHEMIATEHKNSVAVWAALVDKMPAGAMVRNLGKMTSVGLLKPLSASLGIVTGVLSSAKALKSARLHPIALLQALAVYRRGHGDKGSLKWEPVHDIVDALDAGFYAAFDAIEPSGKRMLIALDCSGSMTASIAGMSLSAREASAAMAMVTARSEKSWLAVGFCDGGTPGSWGKTRSVHSDYTCGMLPLTISPRQRLDDVVATMAAVPMGGTDCALPMLYAMERQLDVDVFVIFTDNETWAGDLHPHQALEQYRRKSGIQAKLAVVGMTSTGFTIADPSDAGMMDFVGLDTAAPAVLADFARSE